MPTKKEPHNRQSLPSEQNQLSPFYQTHPAQRAKVSMIATPIGNLSDISPRAEQVIQDCDELWCEDTRHTLALLNALKLGPKRLRRLDQHTDDVEIRKLLKGVQEQGQRIGVVTDAGTPGISDPGARVVALVTEFSDIKLEPIPGPSAVSTILSVVGLEENSFSFQGFFPRDLPSASELLKNIQEDKLTRSFIFFESPFRIRDTVNVLLNWSKSLDFIPQFFFGKELTKIHETFFSGQGTEFLEQMLAQGFDERGEWVFLIVIPKSYVKNKVEDSSWRVTLECLISAGISTKDSSVLISQRFSVAKKLAYQEALEIQKKMKKSE